MDQITARFALKENVWTANVRLNRETGEKQSEESRYEQAKSAAG
jgi:hypothetical protein